MFSIELSCDREVTQGSKSKRWSLQATLAKAYTDKGKNTHAPNLLEPTDHHWTQLHARTQPEE